MKFLNLWIWKKRAMYEGEEEEEGRKEGEIDVLECVIVCDNFRQGTFYF